MSLLTIVVSGVLLPTDASACTADAGAGAVSVTCQTGDEAAAFSTSYTRPGDGVQPPARYDGNGDDTVEISGGTISTNGGTPTFNGGALDPSPAGAAIRLLGGDDEFTMTGGTVGGPVLAGDGADEIAVFGGVIQGHVDGGAGTDAIGVFGGRVAGSVRGGTGSDAIGLFGEGGYNLLSSEVVSVFGREAHNLLSFVQSTVIDPQNETLTGGVVSGDIEGGDGDDAIGIFGGRLGGSVLGGGGNDLIGIFGGTIVGNVDGGSGIDSVTVTGGEIGGNISAESVRLFGGTIGGNISGLANAPFVIDATRGTAPLDLADRISFSGANVVGTIANTDLARAGDGAFRSQNFSGFSRLDVTNSTLGFLGGRTQSIAQLNLLRNSTLHVGGNVLLQGDLTADGSIISMVDGATNDVLRVGDLTLRNARLAVDVNQQARAADRISVNGAFASSGSNAIQVNLIDGPIILETSEVPVILTGNAGLPGNFAVEGIPGTRAALFNYEIVQGPEGMSLRVTPGEVTPLVTTQPAVDSYTAIAALDAFTGVVSDVANSQLGFATGAVPVQVFPTFGIYASGQFARVNHRGLSVSGNGFSGVGPSFSANDFSAAVSLDFNAAKHFGFDDRYGLNIGVFGGYTSSNITLDSMMGFRNVGSGSNRAGMFGAYGLFRQGYNYALISASGFTGRTSVTHGVLNSTGSYGTSGFAATASAGRIFVLSDRHRFDLRGGVVGVNFSGNGYTDSRGTDFGRSRVSFGAVKFEPGVYSDHQLQNGMVLSPYARLELQQRFGYRNKASIAGTNFDFDDADFSTSVSGGFNLRVSSTATVSAEVRGKFSSDSSTIAGKIGLKASF